MKERTEIDQQSLHFTYMELASCRTYDDARDLLNELVTTEIGREYGDKYHFNEETDEYICDEVKYKNSVNPKVVKLAVIDAMTSFLNSRELLSEEGTIAYEKAKAKDTAIIQFKRMDNDMRKVRDWVQRWQKEPAPKTKTGKVYRLRPKTEKSVNQNIGNVFHYFVSIGCLDEESVDMWEYLCGYRDSVKNKRPISWHGEWTKLCALIEVFLCNETYFMFEKGVRKHFICDNMFVNDKGTILSERNLASSIEQAKNNGSLDREKEQLEKVIEQVLNTK